MQTSSSPYSWGSGVAVVAVVMVAWELMWGGFVVIRSEYGDTFVGLSKNPCTAGADSVSVS